MKTYSIQTRNFAVSQHRISIATTSSPIRFVTLEQCNSLYLISFGTKIFLRKWYWYLQNIDGWTHSNLFEHATNWVGHKTDVLIQWMLSYPLQFSISHSIRMFALRIEPNIVLSTGPGPFVLHEYYKADDITLKKHIRFQTEALYFYAQKQFSLSMRSLIVRMSSEHPLKMCTDKSKLFKRSNWILIGYNKMRMNYSLAKKELLSVQHWSMKMISFFHLFTFFWKIEYFSE